MKRSIFTGGVCTNQLTSLSEYPVIFGVPVATNTANKEILLDTVVLESRWSKKGFVQGCSKTCLLCMKDGNDVNKMLKDANVNFSNPFIRYDN
jgi:hypothetical protein